MMGIILAVFFSGVIFFAYWLGLTPRGDVTIIAQMAQQIFGDSVFGHAFFFIFQIATALILAVAANTGYSAFQCLLLIWRRRNTCLTCLLLVGHV